MQAGQEAFRAIMRSFYKGICGIFFTFGIDS
jgi:GTPase SAR1 family protein